MTMTFWGADDWYRVNGRAFVNGNLLCDDDDNAAADDDGDVFQLVAEQSLFNMEILCANFCKRYILPIIGNPGWYSHLSILSGSLSPA